MPRQKPRPCPACGSNAVIPIVYGMPAPETFRLADEGKVDLGGCVISDADPHWRCTGCECGFG